MLGASVGEAPTAYLVQITSWRETMVIFTFAFIVLAILIGLFVRDFPTDYPKEKIYADQSTDYLKTYYRLKKSASWINGFYAGMIYARQQHLVNCGGILY